MTAPTRDAWAEQRERTPKRRMPRGSFPAAFLTFSLLVLVFAVGFVIGRVVIARAYIKAGPDLEQQALPQGEGKVEPPPPALTPGLVSVPEPYEPPSTTTESPEGQAPVIEPAPPGAQEGQRLPGQGASGSAAGETPPPSQAVAEPAPRATPAGTERPTGAAAGRAGAAPGGAGDTGARRYALQAGVFVSQQGARDLADELTRAGYPASVEPDRGGAQTTYRVLTGRYRSEDVARREAERLRADGFDTFVVQR